MGWHINTKNHTPHPHSPPHSHLQHFLTNLHLLIYCRVLEELHAEVALPQRRVALHAVARAANEQHLNAVLASATKTGIKQQAELHFFPRGDPPWAPLRVSSKHACVSVCGNFPQNKADLCLCGFFLNLCKPSDTMGDNGEHEYFLWVLKDGWDYDWNVD